MTYGDTCGNFKLCMPKVVDPEPLDCSECAETTIGKRLKLTFTGGNVIEYIGGNSASRRSLTGTAYSGVMVDLGQTNNKGARWRYQDPQDPIYNPLTNDQFFPATIYEQPTFGSNYTAWICGVVRADLYCNQTVRIIWQADIMTFTSPTYSGLGNYSTDYASWTYEQNVSRLIYWWNSFGIDGGDWVTDAGGECDHDYTRPPSSHTSTRWVTKGESLTVNPVVDWV